MAKTLKHDAQYTRLPGQGKSFMGASSYWLGPDHLLVVRVENYTERYQRFSYRDIQAIFVHRNLRYLAGNTLGLIFFVPAVLTLIFGSTEARIASATPALVIAILLAVNLMRGPTCNCYIQTAVHTEKLGLNRLRAARRNIEILKTRIDQAQATEPSLVAETGPAA